MNRALLVLLAMPASALAQTAGTIVLPTDQTTINIAQCTGTPNDVRSDDLNIELSWTISLVSGATFQAGGKYQLWASNRKPGTTESGVTPCQDPATGNTTDYVAAKVGSTVSATTQTANAETYSLRDIAAAAGYGRCASGTSATVFLCVQWLPSGGTVSGFATSSTNLGLDLSAPSAPTDVRVDAGDGALRVSCSHGDDATSFKAVATRDGESHSSGERTSCSDLEIDGLENGATYSVVVYGLDDAKNPSPASATFQGTPEPTVDFYQHYKDEGGQETGGCSTAAGTVGLLGVLALLALRRRKP